jgi:alkylation response protein AidB-like acyl-CoA dehydrogenase
MSFTAPVRDQRLLLDAIAVLGGEGEGPDSEIVDAVLVGAAEFAEGVFAPLDRIGDSVGARWDNSVVRMPEGFRAAYDEFVAGGWMSLAAPAEHGGQGLPLSLSAALMEDLQAANTGFAMLPVLSLGAIEALEAHGSEELKRDYLPKIISGEWPQR